MTRPELTETLTALVSAVLGDGPVSAVDVDLTVPMEVAVRIDRGELVFHAAPGHTRFVSGFLPPVHRTRLHIIAEEHLDASDTWPAQQLDGWSS
jgi:hypothetical protein